MSNWQDVRGPDGRLLFRFDPARMLVEISARGQVYLIDLTTYMALTAAVIETDISLLDSERMFVVK